ncbi:MAG: molybdopterin-containing oxidoreductase family protein [Thermodesulfobacteriota bacterium]
MGRSLSSRLNWTRREFLKVALGATAGGAGLVHFSKVAEALGMGEVSRFTGLPLDAFPTTCTLCKARCGILGFLHDGRLRALLGNPNDPNSRGRICIRGLSGMNIQEDPERILYPMIRTGRRGEGRWKRISWDEAFVHLVRMIQQDGGAKRGQLFVHEAQKGLLTSQMLEALSLGRDPICMDDETIPSSELAHRLTWGAGRGIPDISRAKTIINFGSNPYDHHELFVPFVQRLVETRLSGGAKLITFDPRLSETAGLSDEWHPLMPGTDGLVALAMANVIVQGGLGDRAFVEEWTNCPWERLRQHLAPYTVQRAQQDSGIDGRELRRIAIEFATRKPSVAFAGDGVALSPNGTEAERCILLLNAVVGAIDQPGGYCLPRRFPLEEADLGLGRAEKVTRLDPAQAWKGLIEGHGKAVVYLAHMANPAHGLPQGEDVRKALEDEGRIGHLVVMDTHMSETAALADLVLPAATYLEGWGLESSPSMDMSPFVGLRQPIVAPVPEARRLKEATINRLDQLVVRPRGEALPWEDFLLGLAWRLSRGGSKGPGFRDAREYVERLLASMPGIKVEGGLGALRRSGVWSAPDARPRFRSFESGGFPTASRRMEIFSSALEKKGASPLPSYVQVEKPGPGLFLLIPFRSLSSDGHPNAKWLRELAHENLAWINETTAKALGLTEGDCIELDTSGRRAIAKVHITQGLHPGVLAISRGSGHWGYGHFAKGKPFKSADPDSHLIWWERHGGGVHIEPLIPIRLDPMSHGQVWMGTMVKARKV